MSTSKGVVATMGAGHPCWYASHELRTPLFAIKSVVEMLLDGSLGRLAPDAIEAVTLMAQQAERLEKALALVAEADGVEAASRPGTYTLDDLRRNLDLPREAPPPAAQAPRLRGDAGQVARALALLLGEGERRIDVEAGPQGARLLLPCRLRPAEGDGAIAWELAARLLRQNGGKLMKQGGDEVCVVLGLLLPSSPAKPM